MSSFKNACATTSVAEISRALRAHREQEISRFPEVDVAVGQEVAIELEGGASAPDSIAAEVEVSDVGVTPVEMPVLELTEPEPSQFQDDLDAIDGAETELDMFE